jgi:hypothetical protein
MPPRAKKTADAAEKPARKGPCPSPYCRFDYALMLSPAKSSSGGGRKKLTPFNKFMQTELARLKEDKPDITHQERCATISVMFGRFTDRASCAPQVQARDDQLEDSEGDAARQIMPIAQIQ